MASLADGPLSISVRQEDIVSNIGSDSMILTKDAATPLIDISAAPQINASNVKNYYIRGNCSENGKVAKGVITGKPFTGLCQNNKWSSGQLNLAFLPPYLVRWV